MGKTCSTYGVGEVHTGFEWGNLTEGDHLEDLDVGCYECGDEPTGSIKCREFLE